MRFRRLDLLAFGPFSDLSLDLSAGSHGLHLIYGPNEAGKTSTLRAIHDLLYGIPHRSTDNFRFDHKQMRIGAEVEDRLGNVLAFRRRKGNKDTLLTADDDERPIDPELLDRFLGGVDAETFRTLFGIGHRQLIEGGRAILEGQGQIGQILFAAGSGLTGLKAATGTIQAELDQLFKPRGQVPEINRLLAELAALRKQVQEAQLPTEEWSRHDLALREATCRKEELDRDRQDRSRERNRLLRIQNALKPIAERDELLARCESLQDVVPLPPDFADRHRSARESLTRALALAEQARADLLGTDEQLAALTVPADVLDRADRIESIYQRLGEYRKGQKDRPDRLSQLTSDEHYARDLLVELGKPRDLEAAGSLRLRADEPELIRELGRQRATIDANLDRHRQALASQAARLEDLASQVEAIGPEPETAPLRRAIRRCRKLGDPEQEAQALRLDREQRHRALLRDLQALPHWDGSIDDLQRLRPPLEETIAEASRGLAECRQAIARREQTQAGVEADLDAAEAEIRALQLECEVPTEADLASARRRRDDGWRLVRRRWLDQPGPGDDDDDDQEAAFLAEFAPGGTLDGAFERSVSRADEQADRLRREAGKVAILSNHMARRDSLERRRDELRQALRAEADRLDQARLAWADCLRALGLPAAFEPEELRAWLRRREAIIEAAEALRAVDRQIEALERTIGEHREEVAGALQALGQPDPSAAESLADRADRAEAFLAESERRQARRDEVRKALDHARRERDEAERNVLETTRQRQEWQERWGPLMARIGLEPEADPKQADTILERIARLFELLESARGFRSRIEGIDRDARQFTEEVGAIAAEIAPDLADRPVEAAVAELYRRLGDARDRRKQHDTTRQNREAAAEKLRSAEETICQERARLVALCREARCDDPDDLPRAEAAAADRARLEDELRRVEGQIRDLCAGATLDAFIDEARSVDADTIDLRLGELDEELEAIEGRRSALDQAIGAEREWLRAQHGGAEAAEAAERTQSLLAELRSKVEDYAALRIATELLHRGIEQFREEKQGPVIRRAGELFALLTAGSFERLDFDEDDHGQPVLLGVRDGRRVGVSAMSDGSCDQLYLALRLASLEGWLDRHEPIPLIVDDILLNFDDERSAAALHALAELSRRTQVLFFTHHEHLVDLARSSLPPEVLFLHRLERSAPLAAALPVG